MRIKILSIMFFLLLFLNFTIITVKAEGFSGGTLGNSSASGTAKPDCQTTENVKVDVSLGVGDGGGFAVQTGGNSSGQENNVENSDTVTGTVSGTTGGSGSKVTESVTTTEKGWTTEEKITASLIVGEFYNKIKDDIVGNNQNLVKPGSSNSLAQDETVKVNWVWLPSFIDTDTYQKVYEGSISDNLDIVIENAKDGDGFEVGTIAIYSYGEWQKVENTERYWKRGQKIYTKTEWWFYNTTNADWQAENNNDFVLMSVLAPKTSCVVTLGKNKNEAGVWKVMSVPYFDVDKIYVSDYEREVDEGRWVWAVDETGKYIYRPDGEHEIMWEGATRIETAQFESRRERIYNLKDEPKFYEVTVPTVCAECPDLYICVGENCEDDCDQPNVKCDDSYYEDQEVEYDFSGTLTN